MCLGHARLSPDPGLGYAFDSLGNLTAREDFLQDVYESFAYDRLNRVTRATVHDGEDDIGRAARTYRWPSSTSSTSPTSGRRTTSTAAATPPARAMQGRTRW